MPHEFEEMFGSFVMDCMSLEFDWDIIQNEKYFGDPKLWSDAWRDHYAMYCGMSV